MASRFSFDRRQKTIDHDGSAASYEDPWTGESTPYNPTPLWVTMQRLRVPKLSSSQDAFRHTFSTLERYIAFFWCVCVFLPPPTPYFRHIHAYTRAHTHGTQRTERNAIISRSSFSRLMRTFDHL